MQELATSNFSTLLALNINDRKSVINMPLHRDTWLEVVSQYELDGTYDYLRRNTRMFNPQGKSSERDPQSTTSHKRLREEMENKNREIEELREQVKRQKAELDEKDAELKEKDQIIERLTVGGSI